MVINPIPSLIFPESHLTPHVLLRIFIFMFSDSQSQELSQKNQNVSIFSDSVYDSIRRL